MVTVEWIDRAMELSITAGDRLLDALDERPQTGMAFGCRSGHCGTCRVRIVEGIDLVRAAAPDERETLTALGAGADERLACQLRVDAEHGRLRIVTTAPSRAT